MSRQAGAGAAILVVEDDAGTRRELARNLVAHGYHVAEAATVAQAVRLWGSARPDLVLLDLGLPDRDGLSVVRAVRREATTPIVVLSARGDEAVKVGRPRAGRRRLHDQAVRHA